MTSIDGTNSAKKEKLVEVNTFCFDDTLLVVDSLDVPFKASFRIQLTPDYPSLDSLPEGAQVYLQKGAYGSQWVRFLPDFLGSAEGDKGESAAIALIQEYAGRCQSCFYVAFKQTDASSKIVRALLSDGFRFYHFHEDTEELTYYKWLHPTMPSKVPSYRTSIEGAGIILLSPDEDGALLVFEYGAWSYSGGAVDIGENALETAVREVGEEVGLTVDPSFPLKAVMFFNQSKSRDNCTNDHFTLFVGKATSKDFVLDEDEISKAKWIKLSDFLPKIEGLQLSDAPSGRVTIDDEPYSLRAVFGLKNYFAKRYMVAHKMSYAYPDPQLIFM